MNYPSLQEARKICKKQNIGVIFIYENKHNSLSKYDMFMKDHKYGIVEYLNPLNGCSIGVLRNWK
jgi:hypothetical protein